MTIRTKLLSNTAVGLLSIVLVWYLIIQVINTADIGFNEAETVLKVSNAVGQTAKAIQELSEPAGHLLYDWNVMVALSAFEEKKKNYRNRIALLKELLKTEDNPIVGENRLKTEKAVESILLISKEVFVQAENKITAEGSGKMFAAQAAVEEANALMSQINKLDIQAVDAMRNIEAFLGDRTEKIFQQSLSSNARFSYLSFAVLLFSISLTTAVSFLISRSITRPVTLLRNAAIEIGQGNLAYKIESDSHGELGQLVCAFSDMVANQRRLVTEVKSSSKQIASASVDLSASSHQMTENSERAAKQVATASEASKLTSDNIQAVSAAAEEMLSTIAQISESIQEESRIASNAVVLSKNTNTSISKLGKSSQEIGEMAEVITGIAQQTNLLALNATIEAARAGELGKGFAVVANEVKELANKTATATEGINTMIREIQEDTKNAIIATEDISKVINEINRISESVAGAIEEQTVATQEIARNMAQAATGSKKVSDSNNTVAESSKNTAKGSENILKAAQNLSKMSDEFLELVDRFKN